MVGVVPISRSKGLSRSEDRKLLQPESEGRERGLRPAILVLRPGRPGGVLRLGKKRVLGSQSRWE